MPTFMLQRSPAASGSVWSNIQQVTVPTGFDAGHLVNHVFAYQLAVGSNVRVVQTDATPNVVVLLIEPQ